MAQEEDIYEYDSDRDIDANIDYTEIRDVYASAEEISREQEERERIVYEELENILKTRGPERSVLKIVTPRYTNPQNPKTTAGLVYQADLPRDGFASGSELTNPTVPIVQSSTTGRRWISIQSYNRYALYDFFGDPSYNPEDSAIISIVKKPQNGSPWDAVVQVEDITPYINSQWSNNTNPTQQQFSIVDIAAEDRFEIRYAHNAFVTNNVGGIGQGNIVATHGTFEVDVKVTFASGHIEYFTNQGFPGDNGPILVPVGTRYRQQIGNYDGQLVAYGTPLDVIHQTRGCEIASEFNTDWYSKGTNRLNGVGTIVDFNILTRYKGFTDPSNSFIEAGLFVKYQQDPFNPMSGNPIRLINNIDSPWGDPLAILLGTNGLVTPDQNQTAKQVFKRLDVMFHDTSNSIANPRYTEINGKDRVWFENNYTNLGPDSWYDTNETGSDPTAYDTVYTDIQVGNQAAYLFVHTVYYAENITSCEPGPTVRQYRVCDSPGNPSHFQTTGKDCAGNTIPTSDLPGGANYQAGLSAFSHSASCCTACDLTIHVQGFDASYNTNDGIIVWSTTQNGTIFTAATGTQFSSGSMYTVIISDANGVIVGTQAPAGGATFDDTTCDTNTTTGTANKVTCNSSVLIKPHMQVSGTGIPANTFVGQITQGTVSIDVTEFTLVASDLITPVNATAANTNETLTFSSGFYGQHGALAPNSIANPYYNVCITDNLGCTECSQIVINQNTTAPSGCTNNTAVNYNAAAVIDDGSCVLCDSTTGLLVDPNGTNATPLFDSLQANATSATLNTGTGVHNSDGTLAVSATPISAYYNLMDQDSNSKFELKLYKTPGPGQPSGTGTLVSTVNAGTLDIVTFAATTFTGLDYGYYTIRVTYVDSNSTSTLENCFTEWHATVKAKVCDDIFNSEYDAIPNDPALRDPDINLCTGVLTCCTLTAPSPSAGDKCAPILESSVICNDHDRNVTVTWEYSATGSNYTPLGSYSLGLVTSTVIPIYCTAGNNTTSANWFTADGFYRVRIVAITTNGNNTCIEEKFGNFLLPPTGCTDPAAHNFDPTAECPGPCAYPTYDCDQATGQCYDPWQGTFTGYTPGPYNCLNGIGCCNSYCTPPTVYGCTDPCATNYDTTATIDDGSCTYTACLDFMATNQYQNCCNQNFYSPSQIIGPDNSCCILPCNTPNIGQITTTDETGDCDTFNGDGSVNINVTINNGAQTWTMVIYDNTGTITIYDDPTTYTGSTTSNTYSLLSRGNYSITVTDSFGCTFTELFTIDSTSPLVGCTDPNATNYNALAICDCCCQVEGCLDPNASNFNPNANVPAQCDYVTPPPSPCVPGTFPDDLLTLKACIVKKGSEYLRDYRIGLTDDCTLMNKWKLILMNYLFMQEELSCIFNCADIGTPPPSIVTNCNDLWVTGGPSTGLNHDPGHVGASIINPGEGTTITAYDGFPNGWFGNVPNTNPPHNVSFVGDVVKFELPVGHPLAQWLNGTIWTLTTIPFGSNNPNGMHQGCPTKKIQHYSQCLDYGRVSIQTKQNYYDNFINFVNEHCRDCKIDIRTKREQRSSSSSGSSSSGPRASSTTGSGSTTSGGYGMG